MSAPWLAFGRYPLLRAGRVSNTWEGFSSQVPRPPGTGALFSVLSFWIRACFDHLAMSRRAGSGSIVQ